MGKKKEKTFEEAKVCIPSSSGGHLTHMLLLRKFWEGHDRFWVTFNKEDANSALEGEKVYHCHFPTNRNFWNLIRNTFLAWHVLRKEKPDIIISSGAAIAMPFFLLGKKFFHCKCVYIEVYDRMDATTLAGKFCHKYADLFVVQWPEMTKVYKNSINLGSIF